MPRAFQESWDLYPDKETAGYGLRSTWTNLGFDFDASVGEMAAGRFGGQGYTADTAGGLGGAQRLIPSTNSIILGTAIKIASAPTDNKEILRIISGTGAIQLRLWLDLLGRLHAGPSTASSVGNSDAIALRATTWEFMEIRYYLHDTLGIIQVKVNGDLILNLENVDTKGDASADIAGVQLIVHGTRYATFDDVYCDYDSLVWVGEGRISEFYMNADTVDKDFTPSVGTDNFATLDEVIANITDYNSSSTPGALDLFTHQAMAFDPVNIFSVQISMLAAKDEAGTRVMRSKLVTGATTQDGPDRFLAQSFAFLRDIYETNPDTALPWTRITFNNAKVGYELVS